MCTLPRLPLGVVASFLLVACGGGASAPPSAQDLPLTLQSDNGALHLVLSAPNGPLAVGTNAVELVVTRASTDAAVDGLDVKVEPYMPAMGHGSSTPTVTPEGGGKYLVSDLYLYMPGVWELRTTFTGAVSDHADPEIQVQ